MTCIKIIGAGSIGNHMAHAARSLGWNVDLCDIDKDALKRTKEEIYPVRYNEWDDQIKLYHSNDEPKNGYELIVIGTPPDSHIPLALKALDEEPRAILIEKPICEPSLSGANELISLSEKNNIKIFSGYNHVLGEASDKFSNLLTKNNLGTEITLDVEFREHWGGIFSAHPWLQGPGDTYLGSWKRGGGASGEHSHAINLWQHFAHQISAGRINQVQAMLDYVDDGNVQYDKVCQLNLRTESGLLGRVVQDVVTNPPRKWARAQGKERFIEWQCGYEPGTDTVLEGDNNGVEKTHLFQKTRPDDFVLELKHISRVIETDAADSTISIERGLDTMMVVAAAHKSNSENRTIHIDYSKGYCSEALVSL